MNQEEIQKIKEEIKEELKEEMKREKKGRIQWTEFKNKEMLPILNTKFDPYTSHKIVEAFATISRTRYGKSSTAVIKGEEMEVAKKDVYTMLETFYGLKKKENRDDIFKD